ncbi:hypothetical protein MNB_ARC-1_739 [hydrothermal vent metagenome]|uniref:Fibrobacter succinogenes major paralogous domain-containing protein n=1 Tax=hydrothermal vent metagenome TaxID=652676 RepID=A0A3B1E1A8_9ZZZZ
MPSAGYRSSSSIDGSLIAQGSYGYLWSSSLNGSHSRGLNFYISYAASSYDGYRADGLSVRCVRN